MRDDGTSPAMILQKTQLGSVTTGRQSTQRRRGAAALAALAAALLAGCGGGGTSGTTTSTASGTPAATGPSGRSAAEPAPRLLPPRGACAAGPAFRCARLRVPLDRGGAEPADKAAPARLTLQVAVTRGGRPPKGYLVVLTGGPGQPGLRYAAELRARIGTAAAGYGLVLLDQRGTGANALSCPQLQRSVGSSDVAVAARGSVEACAQRLGARRGAFTTAATVGDLEDLRVALGARRLGLLGISYGSFVAERYALTYPDRIRGLVLDSVVPQKGLDGLLISRMAAVPRVLSAVCARARCRADVRSDLRAALARGVDGVALLDALVALSVGRPRLATALPPLHAAAQGRLDDLVRLTGRVRATQAAAPATTLSAGLRAATLCAEADLPWPDATTPPADREQALAQTRAKLTPGRLGGFEPATAITNGLADTCRRWTALPAAPAAPTGPLPPVPTLMLAGGLDLLTPVEDARAELARAPRGTLVEVPGAGHSVVFRDRSGCAVRALGRFLAGRPVATGCG
jgi:pimeloyl-ACP methyl ester carboxylesterase